jgi:hypothetical protein
VEAVSVDDVGKTGTWSFSAGRWRPRLREARLRAEFVGRVLV